MNTTDRLPAPMRKGMYLACLQGASNALNAFLLGKVGREQTTRAITDANHDLRRALTLLKMAQGGTQEIATQILHSEAEATAIAVISMAADGLDSNRPTPHDWALQGAVRSLHAYIASQVGQDASSGK